MQPTIDPQAAQRYREQFNVKYGDGFRQYAKQKGYTDDEINQYIQAKLPAYIQQEALNEQQNQATQPTTKKGSLLTSLLPTGGGVGGALAGGAAGAAIGSVVPVIGTGIGGLIGAVLGGAGGSALGKVGENAAEGETDLSKGVGQEALFGGLTSLPIGAGLKLARAGVKVATGVGKKAAGDLVQEAGVQTLGKGTVKRGVANATFDDRSGAALERLGANTTPSPIPGVAQPSPTVPVPGAVTTAAEPLSTSLAGRLKTTGDKALLSQYGTISKPFARSTDPAGTISALADAGITKPVDVERIASQITGADGLITKATSEAVGKAGGVNTSTLRQVFNDAADNYGLVEKDRASLQKVFDAQMNRVSGGAKGSLDPNANPTDALAMMKSLEKRIANLTGKGDNYRLSTPERQDQANVLKLVRDELEDQLYKGAGANKNLKSVLTPELRDKLVALQPDNPQWAKYVDDKIIGAKDVAALRGSVAPFVRGGKIIDEGEQNAATFGGRVGNAFAGGNSGVKGMIGEAVTSLVKNPAARLVGKGLRSASGAAGGVPPVGTAAADATLNGAAGTAYKTVGQKLIPLTIRQGIGTALANGTGTDNTDPTTANSQSTDLASALYGGSGTDPSLATDPNDDTSNPYGVSLNEVAGKIREALATGDTKGYAQLTDFYDRIAAYNKDQLPAATKLSSTQVTQANNAGSGLDDLNTIAAAIQSDPNVILKDSIPGGGIARGITGTQNYDAAKQNVVDVIARLRSGAAISTDEANRYLSLLPGVGDTQTTAMQKIQRLYSLLSSFQNPQAGASDGSGTSLTSALTGA